MIYMRKYTLEFKQEAVKLVTEQGYSQAQAARNLGVPEGNLHRWVSETRTNSDRGNNKNPIKTNGKNNESEEIQLLHKKINRLELERDILKKAAAFFARELN